MTYQGHIENGKVVFDTPVPLPEGTKVDVVVPAETEPTADTVRKPTLAAILKYAGMANDLPPDASENIDHYLYGHLKQ